MFSRARRVGVAASRAVGCIGVEYEYTSSWKGLLWGAAAVSAGASMVSASIVQAEVNDEDDLRIQRALELLSNNKSSTKEEYDADWNDARVPVREERHRPRGRLLLIAGTAHKELAISLSGHLDTKLCNVDVRRFADGEVSILLKDNVRGADCYVIQPTSRPANDNLIELLLLVSALRRNSADTITAVIPFYGYCRDAGNPPLNAVLSSRAFAQAQQMAGDEDLEHQRLTRLAAQEKEGFKEEEEEEDSTLTSTSAQQSFSGVDEVHPIAYQIPQTPALPIAAADVARLLEAVGVDNVIVVDWNAPRTGRLEGFFSSSTSVEHVRAYKMGVSRFALPKYNLQNPVVIAPNETCAYLASHFQRRLERKIGRSVGIASVVDSRSASGGVHRYLHDPASQRLKLVGNVQDSDVILVDTLIDSAGTLAKVVELLKIKGARRVYAFATHGLFNGEALRRISKAPIEEVVVTDSVPLISKGLDVRQTMFAAHARKLTVLPIAPLLADAIRRVHSGMSLAHLRESAESSSITAVTPMTGKD